MRTRVPRFDPLTNGLIAGLALLVLAALTSVLVARANQPRPDLSKPEGVVMAYIQAVQQGDADRAWNLLDHQPLVPASPEASPGLAPVPGPQGKPAVPPGLPKDEFVREVQDRQNSTPNRIRILNTTESGDRATVTIEVTTSSGRLFSTAHSFQITVDLRRSGTSWLITSYLPPSEIE